MSEGLVCDLHKFFMLKVLLGCLNHHNESILSSLARTNTLSISDITHLRPTAVIEVYSERFQAFCTLDGLIEQWVYCVVFENNLPEMDMFFTCVTPINTL